MDHSATARRSARVSIATGLLTAFVVSHTAYADSVNRAGALPIDQPEYAAIYDWWLYRHLDSSQVIDGSCGPYRLSDCHHSLPFIEKLSRLDQQSLLLFGFTRAELTSAKQARAQSFESIRLGLAAQPHPNIAFYASFLLDERRAEDPAYSGKKYRGLAGDVEHAYAHLVTGHFDALVGRFGSFWGNHTSALLAGHAILDGFEIGYERRRFGLRYRLGRLDALQADEDTVGAIQERYVALHRLVVRPWDQLEIGLFEAVVFGGVGRDIDLYYLNPLLSFHSSQLNEDRNDNSLMGFDWHYRPSIGWKLHGQLLIDDFQIDNETPADKEPDQYALTLVAATTRLFRNTAISAQYTRVTNWTFNQSLPRNRYLFENRPLGAVTGNDYEKFTLEGQYWFSDQLRMGASLEYVRQGEGRVDAPWSTPWLSATGEYDEPFPTGIVETTWLPQVTGASFVADHLLLSAVAGVRVVSNESHQPDQDRTIPFIQLSLSLFGDLAVSLD